jgi:uncharacterized membrane protein
LSRKALRRLAYPKPGAFVLFFALLYSVLFVFLSIYKHEIYASSRFDLGNMDQAVWNSARGDILEATDETGEISSRLKNHADFLLLAFVPFYWIYESPYWLLIVQAITVGLGTIPLYWLCLRFLGRQWPAAFIAVAYLFNPGLQAANLFDFHAQMMAGTLLLFAFHYLLERRLKLFLLFAVLAALAKEEIVLLVAMMGLYAVWPLKRPKWGIPIFLAGTAYFLFVMKVLIPAFNPDGDTSELVGVRYEAFGGSITGVLRTALTDPFFMLGYALSGARLQYILQLLGLAGGFAVFSPLVLAIPLPELAINVLSQRPQMVSIRYHYSAPIIPFVYLATAAGLYNVLRFALWLRARNRFPGPRMRRLISRELLVERVPLLVALFILLMNVQMNYEIGPLPWFHSPENHSSVIDPPAPEHLEALDGAVARIPPEASVSASNWIGPHLAHRDYLYLFPLIKDADYVVVDERKPGYDTFVEPVVALQSVRNLREDDSYELIYSENGVLVFERRP